MNASANKQPHIAITCAYAPVEIISAAGFAPIRLIPFPRPSEAEPFIHPLTCGYVKSLLAAGMKNDLSEMAGIIIVNCCDGMRKLSDIWKNYVSIPSLMLDVPKNRYLPNGHNYQRPNLTAYLPGNGGLLAALAMMAAGWTGGPSGNAPGFPSNGKWSVRHAGLHAWL